MTDDSGAFLLGASPRRLAVGIDLVEVARIAAAHARFGDRFLNRIFTPAEQELLGRNFMRLAGRFAVKEACAKALGTGIGSPGWQDIECLSDASGKPYLCLHRTAADLARALGWATAEVSISTTRTQAVACVVALGGGSVGR